MSDNNLFNLGDTVRVIDYPDCSVRDALIGLIGEVIKVPGESSLYYLVLGEQGASFLFEENELNLVTRADLTNN